MFLKERKSNLKEILKEKELNLKAKEICQNKKMNYDQI